MRGLFLVALLGIAVICIIGIGHAFTPMAMEEVRHTREMNELREDQAARWQRNWQPAMDAVLFTAGAIGLLGVALGGVGLLGAGCIAAYHAAQGVQFDRRYQMARLQAETSVLLASYQFQHPQVPHSLTYAPAPRFSNSQQGMLPEPTPAPHQAAATFADLLNRGRVGSGQPLLLGLQADGGELVGSWLDLYSTAVAGLPGTGKTTSQRFLAAQTALHGAKFVVCDPHWGAAEDSLGGTLNPLLSRVGLCEVASTDKAILDAVKMVDSIGKQRMQARGEREPLIIWIDEATALLNRSTVGPALAELLEGIAQEYRKVGVYASISGQIWTAERAGGSALRDSLASCLVHRMKRPQARLLVPADTATEVERLSTGRAILYRTSGQLDTLTIPNTTNADMKVVASLLSDQAASTPAATLRQDDGSTTAKAYSAEERRILDMFTAGASIAEIAREMSGAKNGRRYTEASERVQAVVRGTLQAGECRQ
jgi:hypothetical protein